MTSHCGAVTVTLYDGVSNDATAAGSSGSRCLRRRLRHTTGDCGSTAAELCDLQSACRADPLCQLHHLPSSRRSCALSVDVLSGRAAAGEGDCRSDLVAGHAAMEGRAW